MINVALVGAWHVHAGEYAGRINRNGKSKIVAVWDNDAKRGAEMADRLGVPFVEDYGVLCADSEIQAFVISSSTDMHRELMVQAADAGKHIFTEKVLALTNEDAEAIREAVIRNKIHFTICLPHERERAFILAKQLIDSGRLGKVSYAKFRKAHTGSVDNWLPPHFYDKKECGGGAMVDLGAHPMYMILWLLGTPVKVSSAFTEMSGRGVEDNAVSVIEFEDGAIGVSETGFMTWGDPLTLEVSGSDGYLIIQDSSVKYHTRSSDGWIIPDLPRDSAHPIDYFISSIIDNTENEMFGIDEAVMLTRLMSAAYRSHETGAKADI